MGQSLVELLVTIAIASVMIPAVFAGFITTRQGKVQQGERFAATLLMQEAQDVVRIVRDRDWTSFAVNGTYHPEVLDGRWELVTGPETIDALTRTITIVNVSRNADGDIVSSGGTVDPSTKLVTITVSWNALFASSISAQSILTRHNNITFIDTTEADFNAGTTTDTSVRLVEDGEVILGSTGGYGDWCTPELTISSLDLPKSGVANAISAIQGQIAAGTGENASGVSYANVLVSDPSFPTNPVASISGTFDGYKTNDVFTEANYAYLATDNNGKEIVIIDLANKDANNKYAEAGYFNAPGNGNGAAVATAGNTGFMIYASTLYSFDLSSKSGSRAQLGSVSLPAAGQKIMIVGTRAYIATSSTTGQLAIINISNPSSMSLVDQVTLDGSGAKSIFVNATGSRAYLVTAASSSKREFFIVDIESASSTYKQTMGSYEANGMEPKGVVVVSGPRAIIVGTGGEEYQVIDITNETGNPLSRCGGLQIDTGVNGISTVFASSGRAYSYIITGDASTELKIIEGGPGANGTDYVLSGIFTSQIFDVTLLATGSSEAAFNRLTANITKPSSVTNLTMQVAGADAVSGSCAGVNFVYVGPDGGTSTYYTSTDNLTIAGAIPYSGPAGFANPARCFSYRAYLTTTDHTLTPILKDVTISYSP